MTCSFKNSLSKQYVVDVITNQRNLFQNELTGEQLGTYEQIVDNRQYTLGYIQGANELIEIIQQTPNIEVIIVPEVIHDWINTNKDNQCRDLLSSIESTLTHPSLGYNNNIIDYLFDDKLTYDQRNQRTNNIIKLWYYKGLNINPSVQTPTDPSETLLKSEAIIKIANIINKEPEIKTKFEQGYFAAFIDYGHLAKKLIQTESIPLNQQLCSFYEQLNEQQINLFEAFHQQLITIEEFENYAIMEQSDELTIVDVQDLTYKALCGWINNYHLQKDQ